VAVKVPLLLDLTISVLVQDRVNLLSLRLEQCGSAERPDNYDQIDGGLQKNAKKCKLIIHVVEAMLYA